MLTVTFHGIKQGRNALLGSLSWDGHRLIPQPPGARVLAMVLGQPVCDVIAGKTYAAKQDPAGFLHALHKQYRSPYFQASMAHDDQDQASRP